jgi:hypothetical protein
MIRGLESMGTGVLLLFKAIISIKVGTKNPVLKNEYE